MWIAIISGLLVSIDALFIGISFGTQKKCRFWHILVINAVLLILCLAGYFLGIFIGDRLYVDFDLIVGITFIILGLWVILSYFIFEHKNKSHKNNNESNNNGHQTKNIVLTGIFMSVEAMFITLALTLTLDVITILIPLTVAFAHFIYSTVTFFLSKYFRKFPSVIGHVIAGVALVAYGIMAIVI